MSVVVLKVTIFAFYPAAWKVMRLPSDPEAWHKVMTTWEAEK
jgi:hypothetical protein